MNIQIVKEFLLWCMLLNMGLLIISFIMVTSLRQMIYKKHGKWFKLTNEQFDMMWYGFLSFYKICVFVFNVVPYLALIIIS